MSVHKLFYKFIKSPMNDEDIHEIIADENTMVLRHQMELPQQGDYEIEYWSVDDAGNMSDKEICKTTAFLYEAPKPVVGGVFSPFVVLEDLSNIRMNKANVSIVFSRNSDCFGYAFSWSELDLEGFVVEQDLIEIPVDTWLCKKMVGAKAKLHAEMMVSAGKKLYVTSNGVVYEALVKDSEGKLVIHHQIQNYIENYEYKNGRIFFDILKPSKFEWR